MKKIIIKFLKKYCLKNNLKLAISTRILISDLQEKKLHGDILGESGWDYYPRRRLIHLNYLLMFNLI